MKKMICVLAAFSLLLGIASCGHKGNDLSKAKKVSADEPWWNDTITNIAPDEIIKELSEEPYQLESRCFAADEDSFVVSYVAWGNEMFMNTILRHYSYSGELLGQVNIGAFFGYEEEFYSATTVYKRNGNYYVLIVDTVYEIDFADGKLKNPYTLELSSPEAGNAELSQMVDVGGKTVCLFCSYNRDFEAVYGICVFDGINQETIFPDLGKDIKLEYLSCLSSNGEAATFIAAVNQNGLEKTLYCTLDVNTLDITTVNTDHDIEYDNFVGGHGVFDAGDGRTISRIDPSTGDRSVLVDLSDTLINGRYTYDQQIVWATDDKVVLLAEEYALNDRIASSSIVLLEKAGTNPNAGKAVLSIASLDELSYQEYFAINDFNRNSDGFFIEVEYKYFDMLNDGWQSQEENSDYDILTSFAADTATVLMSDIREGKGPDLVIYSNEYGQLNGQDYLVDLTKRIASEKSLNGGEYMSFVTQPNGRDGNHYRLDYGFTFAGFVIRNDLIENGTAGLTFEQYDRIIREGNNGVNILPQDDNQMMKKLLTSSDYMSYDKDGKISLNNDGFRAMADYIASIPDGAQFDDLIDGNIKPVYWYVNNFPSYADVVNNAYADYSIIGLPSSDGHSETIMGRGIGITSCCVLQDAAWSFAMKMMSPEVQLFAEWYDPVLLSAQKENFSGIITTHNAMVKAQKEGTTFPEEAVDAYIGQISDAIVVPDINSSIIVIMNEEMPAYFENQKSFDEVAGIVENRVNLMLAEQG
ncbi:MAG: hypothetical protein IKF31_07315 [Clostridiales bacterium]|nr:hypothetical protein [Clostridiales bacterium]